jgi:hypothetical protein
MYINLKRVINLRAVPLKVALQGVDVVKEYVGLLDEQGNTYIILNEYEKRLYELIEKVKKISRYELKDLDTEIFYEIIKYNNEIKNIRDKLGELSKKIRDIEGKE